jgi:hypothetical protein
MSGVELQPAVRDLLAIASQFTDDLREEQLEKIADAIDQLKRPISKDDALALLSLLPANGDLCYEVNWPILHAIESCEDWPIWSSLRASNHEWVRILNIRLRNGGYVDPKND